MFISALANPNKAFSKQFKTGLATMSTKLEFQKGLGEASRLDFEPGEDVRRRRVAAGVVREDPLEAIRAERAQKAQEEAEERELKKREARQRRRSSLHEEHFEVHLSEYQRKQRGVSKHYWAPEDARDIDIGWISTQHKDSLVQSPRRHL
uniref:Uncharacterized protein n=1 Tax=Hemiselmis andersenii TaxID=464988 RepID=A0A6T8I1H8_HEMAN